MILFKTFQDVQEFLEPFVPSAVKAYDTLGLDRMYRLMDAVGNPQETLKVIHVAGTSGKTSTCHYMTSLLMQAGQKVGLSVSPHVDHMNERVQVNLVPLPEQQYCREFSRFISLVPLQQLEPTYFELLVAFAYWEFAQQKVDYAVMEVGLGGLYDGTNVVNRLDKVCVITDIGLDHVHILGDTLPAIAEQKAGIIQPGNAVFTYKQAHEISDVFRVTSVKQGAKLYEIDQPNASPVTHHLPLFQQRNWALAKHVYDHIARRDTLPVLTPDLLQKSTTITIPARMEHVQHNGKTIILDGAHNTQKLHAFADSIIAKYPQRNIPVVFTVGENKKEHLQPALKEITRFSDYIILTTFTKGQDLIRQSVDIQQLHRAAQAAGFRHIQIIEQPEQALGHLLHRPEPTVAVLGSFYLMNNIRPALGLV